MAAGSTGVWWRGAPPQAGGTGSGAGPSSGPLASLPNGGYTPTAVNLLVLIALEIGAYIALRWAFRTVHGG
jgi:hypothetical protein